jgi:hypothetical protein
VRSHFSFERLLDIKGVYYPSRFAVGDALWGFKERQAKTLPELRQEWQGG